MCSVRPAWQWVGREEFVFAERQGWGGGEVGWGGVGVGEGGGVQPTTRAGLPACLSWRPTSCSPLYNVPAGVQPVEYCSTEGKNW